MAMLLSKDEFLERVNAWADKKGAEQINARMLEDWNEEAVFPAAQVVGQHGREPIWRYGPTHYRRALIISDLKKSGLKPFSKIRSALWLRGYEIPGGPPRNDLAKEYGRAAAQLRRQVSSPYVPGHDDPQRQRKERTLLKQFGQLAPVLAQSLFKPPPDLMLKGYGAARFGDDDPELVEFLREKLAGLPGADDDRTWNKIVGSIAPLLGLLGEGSQMTTSGNDAVDNSGINAIELATDHELDVARKLASEMTGLQTGSLAMIVSQAPNASAALFRKATGPLKMARKSFKSDLRLRLSLFVQFLVLIKMAPDAPF